MSASRHTTLVLACGALAKEIIFLKSRLKPETDSFDLQCLPADYHNTPAKIVPALEKVLRERSDNYDHILIGYGDCGTGGGLDRLLENYPNAQRLEGAHCYQFYAGQTLFDATMEEELGSFFLTDYLVKHFDRIIIKGMGLDRFPDLHEMYFKHYKRVVYFSQIHDEVLIAKGEAAAQKLGLKFVYKHVGYGDLGQTIKALPFKESARRTHSHSSIRGTQKLTSNLTEQCS